MKVDALEIRNKCAGILLAAGRSQRMGPVNKLLAPVAGKPLVRHAAEVLDASSLSRVIVVIGYEADKVAAALEGLPLQMVFNPDYASGQGSSVGAGIAALDDDISDVLIGLGDMPLLPITLLNMLIAAHLDNEGHKHRITLPKIDGKRGNPVLWGKAFFSELSALRGDGGGRQLLDDNVIAQNSISCDHPEILRDVDTIDALAAINSELAAKRT